MQLFGTLTSPYVRRVRIVAAELGVRHERIDTADAEGQARLRGINPLWRVPTAVFGDETILDSSVIVARLMADAAVEFPAAIGLDRWQAANAISVVDGALDSAINVFYLDKDGVTDADYLAKQRDRVASAMDWIDDALAGYDESPTVEHPSLLAVAAQSTLDWMVFRGAYDVERHAHCWKFRTAWSGRPSFVSTHPPV